MRNKEEGVIATVRVVAVDEENEDESFDFEYPGELFDEFVDLLNYFKKKKLVFAWQVIGNAFSLEAKNKVVIERFKKLLEERVVLPDTLKIDVEWDYWIDDN